MQPERPLIFIPGIMGSKLCTNAGDVLWGPEDVRSASASLGNVERLALGYESNFDAEGGDVVPCGVVGKLRAFNAWDVVIFYQPLFDLMTSLGYEWSTENSSEILRTDWRETAPSPRKAYAFDYDWRFSNAKNAERLESFIEKVIPTGEYDVVAHSMGGVVARLFLETSEKNNSNRLHTLVLMGTPHRGATNTLTLAYNAWLDAASIRHAAVTFQAFYELLPRFFGCCFVSQYKKTILWGARPSGAKEVFDPFDPKFWIGFWWLPEQQRDANFLYADYLAATISDAKEIANVLDKPINRPNTYLLVSGTRETASTITLSDDRQYRLQTTVEDGDGTVPFRSASNLGDETVTRLQSSSSHSTIFADEYGKHNLCYALLDQTSGPLGVTANFSIDSSELMAATSETGIDKNAYVRSLIAQYGDFELEVELLSFGISGFDQTWQASRPINIEIAANFAPKLISKGADLPVSFENLQFETESALATLIRDKFAKSLCIESEGLPICFEAGDASIEPSQSGSRQRVVFGFRATAPDEPGIYGVLFDENIFHGVYLETLMVDE
ncbi:MAG: hypothetical protein H6848_00020 [Caulobacterales bacterium]|nr:hypothetical protein [Caulobacterales bacterium]